MFLLGGISDVEVVDALQHPHRAVDQLADDVGVAGMTLRVRSDMHQDMVQRDRRVPPPPHLADCIQRKFRDRRVREFPGVSVAADDVLSGLVRRGPELSGGPCTAREPR